MKVKEWLHKLAIRTPRVALCFFSAGVLALFLHVLSLLSPRVAAVLHKGIGAPLRAVLALLSALFPFSLAEVFLLGLPVWIALAVLLVRRAVKKRVAPTRLIALFLSFLPLLYALFTFMLGLGYIKTPLSEQMGLVTVEEPSSDELYDTALWLREEVKGVLPEIAFDEVTGASVMPYTHSQMNRALLSAFSALKAEDMPYLQALPVGTKPVLLFRKALP